MGFSLSQKPDFFPSSLPIIETAAAPCYFSLTDISLLHDLLLQRHNHFFEVRSRDHMTPLMHITGGNAPHFSLSLTTPTAYRNEVPEILAESLEKRFGYNSAQRMKIRTCLHEALTNAVIHGNLSLHAALASQEDFASYYTSIRHRIGTEPCKNRRVSMACRNYSTHLELAITDEGSGILPRFLFGKAPDCKQKSGRGLFIIRSLADRVWIGPGRKTLCMGFIVN